MLITIDGPSASGKSTIARELSIKLNYFYLSSGYLYRGLTWLISFENIDIKNEKKVEFYAKKLLRNEFFDYCLDKENNPFLIINNKTVTSLNLLKDEISINSSIISGYKNIRFIIRDLQRELSKGKNTIAEGRDCGTVIFPKAEIKFFLTASVNIRAERICKRNKDILDYSNSLELCKKQLLERDKRDKNREHSPLKEAKNAIFIDNSLFSVEETVNIFYSHILKYISK